MIASVIGSGYRAVKLATMPSVTIRDNPERERYVAEVGGEVVGYTVYHIRHGGIYFFVHTEIDPDHGGKGIGQTLVRQALDDVRAKGGTIVPLCPYVAAFIGKHPDYDDLVDHTIFDRIADRLHNE
jgi:uncharacterized protein